MTDTLIMMALQQEAGEAFRNLPVIFTGVGKINAAHAIATAIARHRPQHIINLGSAGSAQFNATTLVNCHAFIQRDMDVTPLGVPLYSTPFEEETTPILTYGRIYPAFVQAVCGTGDSFHTGGAHDDFHVVDMEAYALAKACKREGIAFSCIKYITDGADGQAASDWQHALDAAAVALREAYNQIQMNR